MKTSHESQKKPIDLSVIVQAALTLLQEEGLAQLTMRKLAARLDIKGASLYWHIKNKNELLSLIADRICKEIKPANDRAAWEEAFVLLSDQLRQTLLKYRDSAVILAETPPVTPHRLELMKNISGIFKSAGFRDKDVFSASWMFNNYVIAFVLEEYRFRQLAGDDREPLSVKEAELPFDIAIPDMDTEFRFGLNALIEGFRGIIAKYDD
ncbi:TetR/AcrR family transcriptional regulator C-terminal domain-containing protein [Paenibacillus arenilitoris]|nr:TetR/AcrR family transcriptional regulator C-terminal domain-containing protein [Paenibacillus arenilitoris]